MGLKYKIRDQDDFYFVTFTVINWIDVFVRDSYREIFINSVKHCQENKGLLVGAWVIMTSHVHLRTRPYQGAKLEDEIKGAKIRCSNRDLRRGFACFGTLITRASREKRNLLILQILPAEPGFDE